jgi:hypothetical protein
VQILQICLSVSIFVGEDRYAASPLFRFGSCGDGFCTCHRRSVELRHEGSFAIDSVKMYLRVCLGDLSPAYSFNLLTGLVSSGSPLLLVPGKLPVRTGRFLA